MSVTESKTDVLIIGAGPAGLMCANWLARAGVDFRLIDKRSDLLFAGQADGLQSRTLETFQSFGFGDRAWKESNHLIDMCFWNPGPDGKLVRSGRENDSIIGVSRFQQVVLHQGRIEQWFNDAIQKWSGKETVIERPLLPVSLQVDEKTAGIHDPGNYPIEVRVQKLSSDSALPEQYGQKIANGLFRQFDGDSNDPSSAPAGTEVIRAKYVVGADGAHSWVRKQLGIEMSGETTDYVWGVLDAVPITDFPDIRHRCAIHSASSGSVMVIPREKGIVRLYIQLKEVPKLEDGSRVDRSKITPELILENARRIFHPYTFDVTDLHWFTGYQIGQRVAQQFSAENRIFIAGDACHTHSPKAGQGMNVSMMDTYNLGWKLAHVIKGLAKPEILGTYEAERIQVARDLIAFDHKLSRLFSGRPKTEGSQDGVSLEEFRGVYRKGNEFASGCYVDYGKSLIVAKPENKQKKEEEEEKEETLAAITSDTDSEFVSPFATHIPVGRRLKSTLVVMQSDGRPWHLADRMPSDGRWRIVNFVGDIAGSAELRDQLAALGEYLGSEKSPLKKYTPEGARKDSVIQVLTVHASPRVAVEWNDLPEFFRSRDSEGRMDYWSVFAGQDKTYHEGDAKAYTDYGIDPTVGCLVVVRPDGYVALSAPQGQEGIDAIEKFFSGFMVDQKGRKVAAQSKIEFDKPVLAV